MRLINAYSRQGSFTGQSWQILRATSTPTPSLGKKVDGGMSVHLPPAIQSVSMSPSISPLLERVGRACGSPRRPPGNAFQPSFRMAHGWNHPLLDDSQHVLRPTKEPDAAKLD